MVDGPVPSRCRELLRLALVAVYKKTRSPAEAERVTCSAVRPRVCVMPARLEVDNGLRPSWAVPPLCQHQFNWLVALSLSLSLNKASCSC
jgi:hypothetical protein